MFTSHIVYILHGSTGSTFAFDKLQPRSVLLFYPKHWLAQPENFALSINVFSGSTYHTNI